MDAAPSMLNRRAVIAFAGLALTLTYGLVHDLPLQQAIYSLIGGAVPVAIVLGVLAYRPERRRPWLFLAAGTAATALGDIVFDAYGWFGVTVPYPSAADVLYLAAYPLEIAGMLMLALRAARRVPRWSIDSAILGLSAAVVLCVVLIAPQLDTTGSLPERLVACAYPTMDVLLLLAVLPLALARPANAALRRLVAAFGLILVADVVYGLGIVHGTYVQGGWGDAIWLVGDLALILGALSPSVAHADEPVDVHQEGWARVGMLALALVVAFAVMAAEGPSWDDDYIAVVALSALTTALALARAGLVYAELQRTSRSLRGETRRLEALERAQGTIAEEAAELDDALAALCGETLSLIGTAVAAAMIEGDELVIRAGAGERAPAIGTQLSARSLSRVAIRRNEVVICNDTETDEDNDRAVSRRIGVRSVAVAPLHFAGTPCGVLVALSPDVDGFDERDRRTLQLMASLGSVAVAKSSEFATQQALTQMLDSSDDAIIRQDLDGTIVSWNAGAEEMYGYAAEEMIGAPIDQIVPLELRFEIAASGGSPVAPYETERLAKDGRRIPVSLAETPVRDAAGKIVGLSTIARDRSERIALENQLHQAQKMEAVGRLAGGVAHDFNNLLLAIEGYGSMLRDRVAGDETSTRYAEHVLAAAKRSAELTQQLLAYSRSQVLNPTVIDPNEIVDEMRRMLERVIGEDIELSCVLGSDVGHVLVDAGRLGQVIMNLGVNARDAMPDGGRLTIETTAVQITEPNPWRIPAGAYARVAVTDTGCGMDAETREQIFEPFFTTKEAGHGTGLGLATVMGTISQSGGYVTVDSEIGDGTCFSVYLPSVHAPARERLATDAGPARGHGERILLVEDERQVREVLDEVLVSSGYEVVAVAQGEDALAADGEFDLLLTDVVMPGMSGLKLAERMRNDRPDLPVLFSSGYAGGPLDGVLGDSGIAFIQKPYTGDELRAAVSAILSGAPAVRRAPVTV